MKRHLIFLLVLLHLFTAPLVAQPLTGGTARKAADYIAANKGATNLIVKTIFG